MKSYPVHRHCQHDDQECQGCPFMMDPNDPQRYVCIKCGRDYSFRRADEATLFILIFVATFLVLLLLRDSVDRSVPPIYQDMPPAGQAASLNHPGSA